jgi:DinB superfamily
MNFELDQAIEVLSATPKTLSHLLGALSADWTTAGNSENAWGPYDILGHLIHGEETDWIPRARIILEQGENRTFIPFDRFAQFERSKGKTLEALLGEFEKRRADNLGILRRWNLTAEHLDLLGIHPELGKVTLRQLLATWVVHDLNHIRQIVTSMAGRYREEVGPWREYLSILK